MVSLADGQALERALGQSASDKQTPVDVDTLTTPAKQDEPAHESTTASVETPEESSNKEPVAPIEPTHDKAVNSSTINDESSATFVPAKASAASTNALPAPAADSTAEVEPVEGAVASNEPDVPSSPVTGKVSLEPELVGHEDTQDVIQSSEAPVESVPTFKEDESSLPLDTATQDKASEPEPVAVKEEAPVAIAIDDKSVLAAESATQFGSELLVAQLAEQPNKVEKDEQATPAPLEDVKQEPEPVPVEEEEEEEEEEPVSDEVAHDKIDSDAGEEVQVPREEAPTQAIIPPVAEKELVTEEPVVELTNQAPATADAADEPKAVSSEPEAPAPTTVDALVKLEEEDVKVAEPAVPEPAETHDTPSVEPETVTQSADEEKEIVPEPAPVKEEEESKVVETPAVEEPAAVHEELKAEDTAAPASPAVQEVDKPSIPIAFDELATEEKPELPASAEEVSKPVQEEPEAVHHQESEEPAQIHEGPVSTAVAEAQEEQEPLQAVEDSATTDEVEPKQEIQEVSLSAEPLKGDEVSGLVELKDENESAAPELPQEVVVTPAQPKEESTPAPETQAEPVKEDAVYEVSPDDTTAAQAEPIKEVDAIVASENVVPDTVSQESADPAVEEEPAHASDVALESELTPAPAPVNESVQQEDDEKAEEAPFDEVKAADEPVTATKTEEDSTVSVEKEESSQENPAVLEPEQAVVPIHVEEAPLQEEEKKEDAELVPPQITISTLDVHSEADAPVTAGSEPVIDAPSPSTEDESTVLTPAHDIETPGIITEQADDALALSIDTESIKPSEIERPKSPWTPSYSVSSQGPRTAEERTEVAEVASEPEPLTSETEAAAKETSAATDIPKSPSWTPSYSVSQQGSPLPPSKELEPLESDVAAVEEPSEPKVEPSSVVEESKQSAVEVPVIQEPEQENVEEPEPKVSTPVLELPEEEPAQPEPELTNVAPTETEVETSKSSGWVPSYSTSRQGSPLLRSAELAADSNDTSTVGEAPAASSTTTAPKLDIPETPQEIERPSSPWTPSYSVTNQGPDTEEPQVEETLDAAPEVPVLQLPSSDDTPAEAAASTERPSSPWTPSYSVTTQSSELKTEEVVEPEPVPVLEVKTSSEETASESASDEKLRSPSPSWTPSYSVSQQGSPMLESRELPALQPEEAAQPIENYFQLPQTLIATEPKAEDVSTPIIVEPVAEQAPVEEAVPETTAAAEEPARPVSPWTPSYSVSRQGSPLVRSADLPEPAAEEAKVETMEVPQVNVETVPTVEAEDTPKGLPWTPSYSVSHQGASDSAEEGLDKLEQLPSLKSSETFPETDKARPPPLQLDTGAKPAPLSPRSRIESDTSSRFFPGGWFSSSPKVPDEGRTSLESAQGEMTPARPSAEEETPTRKSRCLIM